MSLDRSTIIEVINYCKRDIIPQTDNSTNIQHQSEWFISYFSFLSNTPLEKHLGEAFYQARFIYKLMSALSLPVAKNMGIVKFQIIQYASICEAILDSAIHKYFMAEADTYFSIEEFTKYPQAISDLTKITHGGDELVLCKAKKKKVPLKIQRVDKKTTFAVRKGLITQNTKEAYDTLYNLRNNVHILKASQTNYTPILREARDSFILMQKFVSEIKNYYTNHPNT